MAERFEEKVVRDPNSGCWLWSGCLSRGDYGKIGSGGNRGQTLPAHRVAFEIYRGPIPDGLCTLHKCDVRACVNPDHLFLGTKKDNTAAMMAKNRHRMGGTHGERHGRAKLTIEQVRHIRERKMLQREYAALYGIKQVSVSAIMRGVNWARDK